MNASLMIIVLFVVLDALAVIISPTVSYSSHSSHTDENSIKNSDEVVTNGDEAQKTPVTNVTQNDEYDEYSKLDIKNKFF
jgi:flagellar basal body-associated protein FliL